MTLIAARHTDRLADIKRYVEHGYLYFQDNVKRYHEFRRWVFQSSITSDDITLLKELQKPQIEFNILEAYISRLRGEFAKQEPSLSVRAADGVEQIDPKVIQAVEDHLRAIFNEGSNDNMEYDVYTDLLAGGFSVMKVFTEYANEMALNQNIKVRRVFDPTLCGFDPLARKSHKGDGRFAFELYPKSKDEAKKMGVDVSQMKFTRDLEGFNWSYKNDSEEIVLICDFYEKKKKKVKIVQLTTNETMTLDQYKAKIQQWNDEGHIEQPPQIKDQRTTELESIIRYRLVENKVLEVVETDFKHLPLIFVDGNSIMLRHDANGAAYQMTRPYVYHAKGIQRLKNFAGQCLANELENMVMHKFKVAKEAIPSEYKEAYINVQRASVLVYNGFKDDDPNVPLQPPMEIQRTPTPPEVTNTFRLTDEVTQLILGNFDADMAKATQTQTSGVAVQEAATMSNSAAMPYIVGFLKALNQAATIIVDLIPKYYTTPRTIPVKQSDGKQSFQIINAQGHPDSINTDYGLNALEVSVEAGVNFAVQKSRALMQIIELTQASPIFAQFMNVYGLETLLDNIEIRGIDQLKQEAVQFMQQMQKQQEAAQNQPNPDMLKVQLEHAKLQQKGQETQGKMALDAAKLKSDQMKIMADVKMSQDQAMNVLRQTETDRFDKEAELKLRIHEHNLNIHDHNREVHDQHHRHNLEEKQLEHEKEKAKHDAKKSNPKNNNG